MKAEVSDELQFLVNLCVASRTDISGPDWKELFRLSQGHGIQAFVYKRLLEIGYTEAVAAPWEERFRRQAFSNLLLAAEILHIDELCRSGGIPCYFYKGKVWSEWLFGDLDTRGPGDIDVMVREEHLFAMLDMLQCNGYTMDPYREGLLKGKPSVRKAFLRTDYHIPMFKTDTDGHVSVVVEVHWKIAYPRLCFDFSPEEFGRYEAVFPFRGREMTVPVNEYQFLMMLVHHGGREKWSRLKYIVDLTGYLNRYGESTDWRLLEHIARRKGIFTLLKWSLGLLKTLGYPGIDHISGLPIKPEPTGRLLAAWQRLTPIPENTSWQYFLHALRKHDPGHRLGVVRAHLSFLAEADLHWQKLKWYRNPAAGEKQP